MLLQSPTSLLRPRAVRWGLGLLCLWGLVWHLLPRCLELPPTLLSPAPVSQVYLAADGTPLRQFLTDNGQRSAAEVPFERIPASLVNATLAAEDQRFFTHGGIDLLAVARAVFLNAKAARVVSGASTLTQQLIKISSPAGPRTLLTKVHEALLARRLEMLWSKQQIFAAYVNRVSYGNLFTGCATACEGYLHKPLHDLTAAESAFLAALPQAPGRLNPFRDPQPAQKRQQWVLTRMHELGWLVGEEYEVAKSQPLRLQRFLGGFVAPHAVGLIEAAEPTKASTVRTTIDSRLQRRVEAVIGSKLEGLRAKHVEHAAAVVIENSTGHVVALAGSRDFFAGNGGQINGAWAPHSPGSAMKPFTYELAFEQGSTPASIVADLPIEFQTPTGLYRPENYDRKCYGPMTLRYALGNSLNISAVRTLRAVGGAEKLVERMQQLGITTFTESAEHYGLGLTIGNAPVRLIELTNAYATLARLGIHKPWTLLQDTATADGTRILQERACWWIADVLSDDQARMLTFGPRSPLKFPFRVAAKTGTSTSYRDNWTLGYTPEYTVGVWAGNFEGQPMDDVSGVTGAAPIFHEIFVALNDRQRLKWYAMPEDAVRLSIDPRNGKRIAATSPPSRLARDEVFFGKATPPAATASDYEHGTGRALLPREYADWVASKDNWLRDLVTCNGSSKRAALQILSPVDGLVVRLDPDLPGDQRLRLRAQPSDGITWRCDTLTLVRQGNDTFALLKPGTHEIIARYDEETVRSRVRVE